MCLLLTLATLVACTTDEAETPPLSLATDDPCGEATKFSLTLHQDDNENLHWTGLWDECFNLECETIWQPETGLMCIRCTFPLCENGFKWRSNEYCEVPENYTWEVSQQWNFWEGCLTFTPDECLAESIPNAYRFTILGYNCPL
ncbi:MAG: hypothetical protein AAB316_15235 [Bacteroidota bacterium]